MIADEFSNETPALPAPRQIAIPLDQPPPAEQWALVEIFGHRSHMGRLVEVERFGAKLMRVDVPTADPNVFETHYYGGSAIFSIRPMTEEAVRKSVARQREMYGGGSSTVIEAEDDEERPF